MATPLTATPIPAYTALPDVPADLTNLANNLEKYAVTRWASTAARDAAITVPVDGMIAVTTDTDTVWKYNGTAWVDVLERTMPAVMLAQNVSQSIATSTFAAITFNLENLKTHAGLHSTSSNTSRVIIGTVPGTWMVTAWITWQTNSTGTRRAILNLNGVNIATSYVTTAASTGFTTITVPAQLITATNSTDYVELQGWQDSTVSLGTQVANGANSGLSAVRIGA